FSNLLQKHAVFKIRGNFKTSGELNLQDGQPFLQGKISADSVNAGNASTPFALQAYYRANGWRSVDLDLNFRSLPLFSFIPVGSIASGRIQYSGGLDPKAAR